MNSHPTQLEREALETLELRLKSEGYRVITSPEPRDLPSFLGNLRPDAVALGGPPNLLIEVLANVGPAKSKVHAEKIERLRRYLEGRPDWRLEVIYARGAASAVDVAPVDQIVSRIAEVRKIAAIEPAGALLLGWSLLEAAARRLAPTRAQGVFAPGAVIEMLVGEGYLTQDQGATLRKYANRRNEIAHGHLGGPAPDPADVGELLEIVGSLLSVSEPSR